MLKTTDGSVSAVTARYIKAATNRLQIYVTQDDEDIQDVEDIEVDMTSEKNNES